MGAEQRARARLRAMRRRRRGARQRCGARERAVAAQSRLLRAVGPPAAPERASVQGSVSKEALSSAGGPFEAADRPRRPAPAPARHAPHAAARTHTRRERRAAGGGNRRARSDASVSCKDRCCARDAHARAQRSVDVAAGAAVWRHCHSRRCSTHLLIRLVPWCASMAQVSPSRGVLVTPPPRPSTATRPPRVCSAFVEGSTFSAVTAHPPPHAHQLRASRAMLKRGRSGVGVELLPAELDYAAAAEIEPVDLTCASAAARVAPAASAALPG